MDRFSRPILACGLGLFLAASGCRSTQPEVPPGRQFAKDGQQQPAIKFSSEGHAPLAQGSAPYMPSNLGGSSIASGIGTPGGRPDGAAYGGPEAAYGPPGSVGAPTSPNNLGDPSTVRASTPPSSIPLTGTAPANLPPLGSPGAGAPPASTMPDLNVPPPRDLPPVSNPVLPPPTETPAPTASPNALPDPR